MNREAILTALFARLSASASFASASRRLRLWDNVAPADKPALFMVDKADTYAHASEATPETVTMQVDIYISIWMPGKTRALRHPLR